MAFSPMAPPCMNRIWWLEGMPINSASNSSASAWMDMNSLPRWLISITDMPQPRQSSISCAAWRRTGSGRVAGPGLKLKTRVMECLELGVRLASQGAPGLPAYKNTAAGPSRRAMTPDVMEMRAAALYHAGMDLALAAAAPGSQQRSFGEHLRAWRLRRRMSQMDLAGEADISTRHLSFVETGRSSPSREMVLRLAERLEVPLRERNVLLVAAGFAPAFPQRPLDDPALKSARAAIDLVLKAHEPNPALAYDRHWNLVTANRMVAPLLEGLPDRLLGQPFNVLRLAFHPEGLAPRTVNLGEWSAHLLERLHRQCEATADPELLKLYQELKAYRMPARSGPISADNVAIPFKLRSNGDVLSFISTTMVFGTPVDVTLSELALETFFPADDRTAERLRLMAAGLQ